MPGKVLVVESDFASRKNAIASLLRAGYEVCVAEDPFAAAHTAAQESPDLILLGDSMANPSGLSLVGRFFSSAETAAVPVLVIANTPERQAAAGQSGPRRVLPGPVTVPDLLDVVASQIAAPGALTQAPASVLNDADRLAAVTALLPDASG